MSEKRLNNTIYIMYLVTENYKKAHSLTTEQFMNLDQKYNNEIDFLNAYYYIVQNGITKNEAQDVVHTLWEYGLVRGIQYSTIFYDYQLDQAFQNGLAVVGLLNGTPLHAVMITKYKPNTYELGYYDSIYNHVVTASWNPTLFESLISY